MKNLLKHSKIATLLTLSVVGILGLSKASTFSIFDYTNDVVKELLEKFTKISKERPEDRVYLHFDKPFYKPGETIWYKAYVRDGGSLKPSTKSGILYIELINPKGSIDKKYTILLKDGVGQGDYQLDEEAAGGLYKVKAYTQWQKNEENYFEKELLVQEVILPKLKMKVDFERKAYGPSDLVKLLLSIETNEAKKLTNYPYSFSASLAGEKLLDGKGVTDTEGKSTLSFTLPKNTITNDGLLNIMIDYEGNTESISRSIPIVLTTISVSFFPEGGELVAGQSTRLAFKALNEFGKPADIEGIIYDGNNKTVSTFKTFHQGMGAIDFTPIKGVVYTAKITKPVASASVLKLPEVLDRGYTLTVLKENKEQLPLIIQSSESESLSIIAQVRGEIYYANSFDATVGKTTHFIPLANLPIGVAQITLVDKKGIARAERLVFVNKSKKIKISIDTDKEKYLPREKVTLAIKVTDERGIPMPSSLSLSVVDDKLLAFADDKQGNILSTLLLEGDLKGKIVEPTFYFNEKETKAEEALDYLLLTAGWRRFTWEEVSTNSLKPISFLGEKATISGVVRDGYKSTVLAGVEVSVKNTPFKTKTDKEGRFSFESVELYEPAQLELTGNGYSKQFKNVTNYGENIDLYLYEHSRYEDRMFGIQEGAVQRENKVNAMPAMRGVDNIVGNVKPKAPLMKRAVPEKDVAIPKIQKAVIADLRLRNFEGDKKKIRNEEIDARDDFEEEPIQLKTTEYIRAREFPMVNYEGNATPETRTDFRSTLYWNGAVKTDRTGKTSVSFFNSDEITSFRISVEGISSDGSVGRTEKVYFTQLPFSLSAKLPVEMTSMDLVKIPLTLKNNTLQPINGKLTIQAPKGMEYIGSLPSSILIAPNQTTTLFLDYSILPVVGKDTIRFAFDGLGFKDAFEQEISISSKGFPSTVSFSSRAKEQEYSLDINNLIDGSIQASFTAYPNVISDLMKGIESILREPYGCFEQTSTSNYPNIMVKQYLEEMGEVEAPEEIDNMLDKGYKRLISYETKEKGYEWFGGTPAHEGLTAYGLMQFNDMKKVYNVDGEMVNRTTAWLLGRRDGKGGFKRSAQALDQFGRASEDITNAYIVYGLSEAGNREIKKELDLVLVKALSSKDPYQLALAANALFNFGDLENATKAMAVLQKLQVNDGSWTGLSHSITYSQGISLTIETTSLSVLALLKSKTSTIPALTKAIEYLINARSGSGGFGSTQGTVLALKALTEYAKFSKKTDESGTVELYVDGKKIGQKDYKAGERGAIELKGLEQYFSKGKHTVKVRFSKEVQNPLPYSMNISWNTFLPQNDKECNVSLTTSLSAKVAFVGETVRFTTLLKNTTKEGLPMTMVILGIPAGLSAQPWQLKELIDKKYVDFYEVRGNAVFLYYRQMLPEESKEINLDLKAELSGEYEAQASSGYLYYTNEFKVWSTPERITIKQKK